MARESLSERLRRLREKRGLTFSEVARRLETRESTYREWEKGRKIQGEPYIRLAQIYGVSVAYLLGADQVLSTQEILDWVKKDIEIVETRVK